MRLRSEEIERLVDKILLEWKTRKLVTLKAPESKVRNRMIELFTADLKVEDDLDQDVEKILSKYEKQFERGELDRRKMSQMVKNQLVKERKLVL